jgi:hypothetical protein
MRLTCTSVIGQYAWSGICAICKRQYRPPELWKIFAGCVVSPPLVSCQVDAYRAVEIYEGQKAMPVIKEGPLFSLQFHLRLALFKPN